MKKIILLITLVIISVACGAKGNKTETQTTVKENVIDKPNRIEILYFHGKQRCITCKNIEKYSKEVVENDFAKELKNGDIIFKVIDFSTPEGEAIADKYEISFSSLLVNKYTNGKESINDMTEHGFATAKEKEAEFKAGLKEKINELLKK
ncbi:MAG: putative transrane protein [Bacteroidetes bacterium]|nr:putative transrane protein [Bacteroidota bacterium]